MEKKKRKYVYSNKKHTEKGIFSTILAILSGAALTFLVVMSYKNAGVITGSYGATAFLCTLFSAVGIMLGVMGKNEEDKFYLFAYIGIVWNVLDILFVSVILHAGI